MTEEETKKAEEKKEEKEEQEAQPEKSEAEEKKEEEKKEEKEAKEESAAPVKKKINKMTLAEVEAKLKEIKETMGGWDSKYARHLVTRKNFLSSKKSE